VFVTARTPTFEDRVELIAELRSALASLGVEATADGDVLVVDGSEVGPRIEERSHPTPATLAALVQRPPIRLPAMVVADRISDNGRDVLRNAGWGWLDRRGHLRIWTRGVRIETDFRGDDTEPTRVGNMWTTVGLEVALAALCNPSEPITARRIAKVIGRSTGATHELISRFTQNGLIGRRTRLALLPELFWETAAQWPDDGWTPLPLSILDLAAELETDRLVRADERAATLAGARIPAAGDLPARCYLTSPRLLRQARSLAERDSPTQSWVREPPTTWLPELASHRPDAAHPWRIAHPIVSALRLAGDESRGREIVESWGIVPDGAS
jgi:hypothetical protein